MPEQQNSEMKSLVAPCRQLKPLAALNWLKLGWADFKQVTQISLIYGIVMMLISIIITVVAL